MSRSFAASAVDKKDPNEIKYYSMDWTEGVNDGATVVTSVWTIQTIVADAAPLEEDDSDVMAGDLITRVLLSGGTEGNSYEVTNTITTSDGETLERTGVVRIKEL
jgi:hypothetical protein